MEFQEATVDDAMSFMCGLCSSEIAKSICVCEYPAPFICAECTPNHCSKTTASFHSVLPVSMVAHIGTREDLNSLRVRALMLLSAEQEARESYRLIEECQQTLRARYEEMIAALGAYMQQEYSALEQCKVSIFESINASVNEAKLHLMDVGYKSQSQLTALLLKKADDRTFVLPKVFECETKELHWDLHDCVGVQWRMILSENKQETDAWMQVDSITSLDDYKDTCFQRLRQLFSPEVASSRLSDSNSRLELEYYREHFFGVNQAWTALESSLSKAQETDLPREADDLFLSHCLCKSQRLRGLYAEKLQELLAKRDVDAVPKPLPEQPPVAIVDFSPQSSLEAPISPVREAPTHASPLFLLPSSEKFQFYHADLNTFDEMVIPTAANADNGSAYVFVKNDMLFFCGGSSKHPVWSTAFQCFVMKGFKQVQSMTNRRRLHGIISYQEDVYVFGGIDKRPLSSSEKFNGERWQTLPSMLAARYSFNPTLSFPDIFLVGGEKCSASEAFSIVENCFRSLPITLPETSQDCAFICDEQLVVISRTKVMRWWLSHLKGMPLVQAHIPLHPWSNCPPLVYQSHVYVLLLNCGPCVPGCPIKLWDLTKVQCSSVVPA